MKTLMLPIAMVGGAVFSPWMQYLTFLSPYLIFTMLFITYCKLEIRDFRPNRFEITLLFAQIILAAVAYGLTFSGIARLLKGCSSASLSRQPPRLRSSPQCWAEASQKLPHTV